MFYISPVDPHVHLRGTEYQTDYLSLAYRDAKAVGLSALIEQPNPQPWLIDDESITNRHKKVMENEAFQQFVAADNAVLRGHHIHIGLTNDWHQVKKSLELVMSHYRGLHSDKTFYTHSTGNMGILDEDYQRAIWKLQADIGYKGVSIGHFEDEKCFIGKFILSDPMSHSAHQNHVAEFIQVERQFRNAYDVGFEGTFYVAHVSSPLTIDFIKKNRDRAPFKTVLEMTFHHMFLNYDDVTDFGNCMKMNPPLRSARMQKQLLDSVLKGDIDVIGTDHAPHPYDRKMSDKPPSGIPAIPFWPRGIELLQKYGIDKELLTKITVFNAVRLFGLSPGPYMEVNVEYDRSLWEAYGWNPFARLDVPF